MTDKTLNVLTEALDDEYKARATYRKVIEKFGEIRPFINIVEAEERHARALLRQFERLGLEPPEDRWEGQIDDPASVKDACAEAVKAEIENAEMYDRLLQEVKDPSVRNVLLNLQDASQNRHLPAFSQMSGAILGITSSSGNSHAKNTWGLIIHGPFQIRPVVLYLEQKTDQRDPHDQT